MKTAWAIRHVAFEDLGLIAPLLQARGYTIRYLEALSTDFSRIDALSPDLLIVLGGPMGARDTTDYPFLAWEAEAIRRRRALNLPTLGICLGAQVMAVSAGGDVHAMPRKEIGMGSVQLTDAGQQSVLAPLADVPVLHWHGDAIVLPAGVPSLATTDACATQAFELPGRALGLQFHLEAELSRIHEWTQGHASELADAGLKAEAIEQAAALHADDLDRTARTVIGAWLDRL